MSEILQRPRIALLASSLEVLKNWKTQIHEIYPRFVPSDRDLIAWAIESFPTLSKKQICQISSRFFDEARELEVLVRQIREAKAKGNGEAVAELLSQVNLGKKSQSPSKSLKS